MNVLSADNTESSTKDNPFQPIDRHPQSIQQPQPLDPLNSHPATHYTVRGVIVMNDNAVAVIYSPSDTWHRLQVHSHLGQERAVVRRITTTGIQIDRQGTVVWLPIAQ